MLDSIYHVTSRILWNLISDVKRYDFVIMYATLLWTSYVQLCYGRYNVSQKSVNH